VTSLSLSNITEEWWANAVAVTKKDASRREILVYRIGGIVFQRSSEVNPGTGVSARAVVNQLRRENFEVGNIWLLKQDSEVEPIG
jgi:hypothetical protein